MRHGYTIANAARISLLRVLFSHEALRASGMQRFGPRSDGKRVKSSRIAPTPPPPSLLSLPLLRRVPKDVMDQLLSFVDVYDLVSVAQTSTVFIAIVKDYMKTALHHAVLCGVPRTIPKSTTKRQKMRVGGCDAFHVAPLTRYTMLPVTHNWNGWPTLMIGGISMKTF